MAKDVSIYVGNSELTMAEENEIFNFIEYHYGHTVIYGIIIWAMTDRIITL